MRATVIDHLWSFLKQYELLGEKIKAIDVGGNRLIYLQTYELEPLTWQRKAKNLVLKLIGEPVPPRINKAGVVQNPLIGVLPGLRFLDPGFTADFTNSEGDIKGDLLVETDVKPLADTFDLAISLDTLEHVSDPFTFCKNLVRITKPGGYLYINTVFSWEYHPSPQDYFRFSPEGLRICFDDTELEILQWGWHIMGIGVFLFGRKPAKLA